MPWHKYIVSGFLLLLGLVLASGNLWVVAARSTIPLALNGEVAGKELRHEKHPGDDDVCLLHFKPGRTLHVDASVYAKLEVGNWIRKRAWSFKLSADDQTTPLTWSADVYGMIAAMPTIFVILIASAIFVCRVPARERG